MQQKFGALIIFIVGLLMLYIPAHFYFSENKSISGEFDRASCFEDKYEENRHHQIHLSSGEFYSMTSRYMCSIYDNIELGDKINLVVKAGAIVSVTLENGDAIIDPDHSQDVEQRIIFGFPFIGLIAIFIAWRKLNYKPKDQGVRDLEN